MTDELTDREESLLDRIEKQDNRSAIYYFWVGLLTVILLITVVLLWMWRNEADTRAAELKEINSSQDAAIARLSADSEALRQELERQGVNPDTVAPDPKERVEDIEDDPTPIPGPPGRDAPPPTQAQVQIAVNAVLRGNPALTKPQIVEAVTAHLQASPPPAGPAGEDGEDGEDGEPGTDAPPPSAETLLGVVTTYCSQEIDPCRGQKGDPGEDGNDGLPGEPPLFWTFDIDHRGEIRNYRCDRVEEFDPASPAYECVDVTEGSGDGAGGDITIDLPN